MEDFELKPVNGRIIVKDVAEESKTDSGIYIQKNSTHDSGISIGEVLAFDNSYDGEGSSTLKKLKQKDKICYSSYKGQKTHDKKYVIVKCEDVEYIM